MRQVRLLLWLLVALAVFALGAIILMQPSPNRQEATRATETSFGGPFTLTSGDGKPFSSASLSGKPYAIFFGFTRCGDVCPTTLGRLVALRRQAGGDEAFNILFVTIDPAHDRAKDVGQYAGLFNSPIIGLTGSQAQIDQVKKQYGIFAQPAAHPMPGKEMEHSSPVLLFDGKGRFAGTISSTDPDADAVAKLKQLAV
jgi:protein SCO1/2